MFGAGAVLSSLVRRRTIVGIYNVPRSGSNFLAACLHCHPRVFAVSERELNWRLPLVAYLGNEMADYYWQGRYDEIVHFANRCAA